MEEIDIVSNIQSCPNLGLDGVRGLSSVDVENQFLSTKEIKHRLRLGMIILQTFGQSFEGVVRSRIEVASANVADVFTRRSVANQVVVKFCMTETSRLTGFYSSLSRVEISTGRAQTRVLAEFESRVCDIL